MLCSDLCDLITQMTLHNRKFGSRLWKRVFLQISNMHVSQILSDICSNYKFNSVHESVQEYLCQLNFVNLLQYVLGNYGGSQKVLWAGSILIYILMIKNIAVHNIYGVIKSK